MRSMPMHANDANKKKKTKRNKKTNRSNKNNNRNKSKNKKKAVADATVRAEGRDYATARIFSPRHG